MKKCLPRYSGMAGGEEAESVYSGSWVHFERLRFLNNITKPRVTSGNLDPPTSTNNIPQEDSQLEQPSEQPPEQRLDDEFGQADDLQISDSEFDTNYTSSGWCPR